MSKCDVCGREKETRESALTDGCGREAPWAFPGLTADCYQRGYERLREALKEITVDFHNAQRIADRALDGGAEGPKVD